MILEGKEKGDIMKNNLYTYLDAKKIYFTVTNDKYLLIEKNKISNAKSISLISRKTTIINKQNGFQFFPKN